MGQPVGWENAERADGPVSFHVPASAPIILPAEKQRVKAGGPQRQKLGFTLFTSAGKGIWRENACFLLGKYFLTFFLNSGVTAVDFRDRENRSQEPEYTK